MNLFREKFRIRAGQGITNIDYNPNKQYCLLSCHHEAIKFWDIRKGNLPIKTYDEHPNLLVSATYNHSHDELIACAYDDGSVSLLRLTSVSSSPQNEIEDAVVKLYDEHEDSVYWVLWSSFSPWVFASLTYNASSLVINLVPSVEKYRILLWCYAIWMPIYKTAVKRFEIINITLFDLLLCSLSSFY